MNQETRYIGNMDLKKAKALYQKALSLTPRSERIPCEEALGRVSFAPVYAQRSSPSYPCAAMDGIAVCAQKTADARPLNPLILQEGNDYQVVNTGNPIDPPFDAVIMKEEVVVGPTGLTIRAAAIAWQHVRPVGEDLVATEMILASRHRIRPFDLGSLLAGGVSEVEVYTQPSVAILPTGSELLPPGAPDQRGRITDSNSTMLRALCQEAGAKAQCLPVCPDDPHLLRQALQSAAERFDVVLVGAGSSAGTKDYTAQTLADLGEVVVHGVAMKPGKPVILGKIGATPVLGIPGYPVSAYLSFHEFCDPILSVLSGQKQKETYVTAKMAQPIHSSLKNQEFLRVSLAYIDGTYHATPSGQGAGVSMSLVRADGIGEIPRNREGLHRRETLLVRLLRDASEIQDRLPVIGSHDICLDLLRDRCPLQSTHVGSMGGVLALLDGEAVLAPVHVLDEATRTYNLPLLAQYFPEGTHALLRGPGRTQGLMVPKGNPQGIQGIADLTRPGVRFINRQRGSGTRIFLDDRLRAAKIDAAAIQGYDREATTHTTVAAAVKEGSATCGAGVLSAARALDLDFIPLGEESYDFLVAKADLDDERVQKFIASLQSESFQNALRARGGYRLEDLGEVIS
ncbi:Molybdopterin biosynthesis protein MoeA / Periplasmic molybdate-binding domain protein [Clostridiaceae bacterium JG1575]|nr:Molybdopterin biosynthesis protein MoeA / Periplasmic molybdate-binding domain protein [Clostridiaceae bacterium JG1575]